MSRRFATLSLALLAAFACSSNKKDAESNTGFRAALLTPGEITDQSWNGGAYQGLLRLRDSLGAEISNIQTKTPAEFDENFRQYGSQGYTLVFGHGFEFQDAAARAAAEFPKTNYVVTSGTTSGPNLSGIRFGFEEPSYAAGVLAALWSKSNVIGAIGGTELPPVKASFEAYANGAKSVKPNIRVLTSYVGNWDDAGAGKEQALAQIGQGADIIFQNADAAGLGVFQAARETKKAMVFGSNGDQNNVAPEVTLASVMIDLPLAFMKIGQMIKDGTFKAQVFVFGESTGVVKLLINPAMRASIPPATLAVVDSVENSLRNGTLVIPVASRDSAAK